MGQTNEEQSEGEVFRPAVRPGAVVGAAAREHALVMAMESTSDAVIVYDLDWRCTYMNERARILNGRDYVGEVVWDVFPETVGGPFYEAYHRAIRTWLPVRVEGFAAGVGRYLEVNAYPSETGLTVFAHDASEERRLAASLRERERLFQIAFEQAAVGIVLLRENLSIVEVNEAFCRIVGKAREEMACGEPNEVERLLDCGGQRSTWRPLLCGDVDQVAYETRYVGNDGGVRFASVSVSRIADREGSERRYFGVVQDVTEKRRAEAERRELEERMRRFVESAPASIAQFDRDMRYLAASRRWRDDYGLTEDVVGRSHYDVFPHLPPAWKEVHRRSMAGESLRSDGERFEREDGAVRWLRWETLPWREVDGEIGGIMIGSEDVTERMRAEHGLRDSEAKFRSVFEQAAVGIVLSEARLGARFLAVNDAVCEMLGYSRKELLNMGFADVAHPDERPAQAERVGVILSGRTGNYSVERRYLHRDGSSVWANNAVSLVRNEAGEPDYFVAVLKDVTERRRAEEALRQATERFLLALRAGPIVLFSQDIDLRYTWVHNAALGYETADVIGKRDSDLFERAEDAAVTEAIKREVIATGVGRRREVLIRHDGLDHWYDLLVDPILGPEGVALGVTCATVEITERKQAENALRESEARLRMTQEAGRIGSWDWDLTTGKLHWSETQCLLFGVDPAVRDDLDIETWRRTLHPDDRGRIEDQRRARFEAEDDTELEYRVVRPDGVRWISSRGHLFRDGDGRPVRMVGVTMDVTERRERDAALRDFAAELEVRVREEIAAREAAQRRAAQAERMQALGQLAGGVAHDFNNVLQAVSGALSMIERRPDDAEFIRRMAKLGGEASGRGASITGRLLAFARQGELRAEALDIVVVLTGIAEILSYTLGSAIEVRLELGDELPPTMADRGQLESVLVNLSTNARDAMPAGGVLTISARAEDMDADEAPRRGLPSSGAYVRIEVADTGVGMDADTLARATEPFFTTKEPGVGTGLGLSMAHGFAKQSGGQLAVASSPGRGATVTLWLPCASPGVKPSEPANVRKDTREGRAGTVLLVDDEETVRHVLAAQLEDAGYRVMTAACGAEAIEILGGHAHFDALVTDLTMPGVDGLAVLQAAARRHPHLPSILLTGFAGDAARLAAGREFKGAFSLMRKPVRGPELVDRLRALARAPTGG